MSDSHTHTLADLALSIAQQERAWRVRDYEQQGEALRETARLTRKLDLSQFTPEHIQLALIQAVAGTRGTDTPKAPRYVYAPPTRKEAREFVADTHHHAITEV